MENNRIEETTPDMRAELLARLKVLVPEAFSDGELDLERLAELAGDAIAKSPERYGLNWPGKREAIAMLQAPSRATLVPLPDASVNFDNAQHVFVEGENLEVLKLLYNSYFGRAKFIYIDPPYNTGNDFVYHDDFADPLAAYLRQTGQMTEAGDLTTSAPEKTGRLHSNWLSMMYPRLSMARQMLSDEGVVFVSIDEVELANLILLMDLVFGDENKIGVITWKNVTDNNPNPLFALRYSATHRNPHEFAAALTGIIKTKLADQLVGGIKYEPDGTWYEQSQFDDLVEAFAANVVKSEPNSIAGGTHIYDGVEVDSETVERPFAEALEHDARVKLYIKLPGWFEVATPIGSYNPDWAIVMDLGEGQDRLYLVRETKGTSTIADLRPNERRKIDCGKKHFSDALGVSYKAITDIAQIL
ncbi:hypothetical protein JQ599_00085 [Bradyrhizobium diazoefficiens]|nr:DNA methyltransferase [Bradyrhizobium diazoefficiens]MBR0698288.1 hypothetical protein [Bradyrhizobium diazoefficiens]MBR0766624.1 hypothetical protein [Bradyrhizobium diazoefficiens]